MVESSLELVSGRQQQKDQSLYIQCVISRPSTIRQSEMAVQWAVLLSEQASVKLLTMQLDLSH